MPRGIQNRDTKSPMISDSSGVPVLKSGTTQACSSGRSHTAGRSETCSVRPCRWPPAICDRPSLSRARDCCLLHIRCSSSIRAASAVCLAFRSRCSCSSSVPNILFGRCHSTPTAYPLPEHPLRTRVEGGPRAFHAHWCAFGLLADRFSMTGLVCMPHVMPPHTGPMDKIVQNRYKSDERRCTRWKRGHDRPWRHCASLRGPCIL
eukprot:SAG31_NODE_5315_length_2613_cov_4.737868_3_plen_205_part_00